MNWEALLIVILQKTDLSSSSQEHSWGGDVEWYLHDILDLRGVLVSIHVR